MAASFKVVNGTLPASGSQNFTSSGFGTPDAAIILIGEANATNNPQAGAVVSAAFWNGSNVVNSINASSEDNLATSDANRQIRIDTSSPYSIFGYNSEYWTVGNTTDGITITHQTGTHSYNRNATVILIGGTTNVHVDYATSGDVTAPGFRPDLVFFLSEGGQTSAAHAMFSLGVAHFSSTDAVSQGVVAIGEKDALSTSQNYSYASSSYVATQLYNDAVSWTLAAGSPDANGFTLTGSPGTDRQPYLAIELPNSDDAWVGMIDAATATGNDAKTGLGFQPTFLGLAATDNTAEGTLSGGWSLGIGVTDGTNTGSIASTAEDAQATTNAQSRSSTSDLLLLDTDAGAADARASLSSFDSDGFTLNYSDAASSAKKILAFAVGDSTAGGPTTYTYTSSGGAVSAGAAALLFGAVILGAGGATSGGAATTSFTAGATSHSYISAGGAVSGGAASLQAEWHIPASGGATSGGAATTLFEAGGTTTYLYTGLGGAVSGGSASLAAGWDIPASGGAISDGAATLQVGWDIPASGGATSGGAATTLFTQAGAASYPYTGAGSATSGGSAALQAGWAVTGVGGATSGGAATTAFAGVTTLTQADLDAIVTALTGPGTKINEIWQRLGLDASNPLTNGSNGDISVGGIDINATTSGDDIIQTRQ